MTSNRRVTPHAGVWIETHKPLQLGGRLFVTPHAGVWIETAVAGVTGDSLKVTPHAGVWIETVVRLCHLLSC